MSLSQLPLVRGREQTARFLDTERAAGRRIVFVNGCFDLLHPGHLQVFYQARSFGDVLVVAANSDESIRRLKGPARPIQPQQVRLAMIAALKPVDAVFCFDEADASEALRFAKPQLYAKGAEYQNRPFPESDAVEELGLELAYLDHVEGYSSSQIIARILTGQADQLGPASEPRT